MQGGARACEHEVEATRSSLRRAALAGSQTPLARRLACPP